MWEDATINFAYLKNNRIYNIDTTWHFTTIAYCGALYTDSVHDFS